MPDRKQSRSARMPAQQHAPHTRLLRVGYLPNQGKGDPKPQIKLAGNWLASLGFLPGQTLQLDVQAGRLVITLVRQAENPQPSTPHITPSSCHVGLVRFGRIIQHPLRLLP